MAGILIYRQNMLARQHILHCGCGRKLPDYYVQNSGKKTLHWAKVKNKKLPTDVAMQNLDMFCKPVFGKKWNSIRLGLLSPQKYGAIVNMFGQSKEAIEKLQSLGATEIGATFRERVITYEKYSNLREMAAASSDVTEGEVMQDVEDVEEVEEIQEVSATGHGRLILPNSSPTSINQFVPASELKGMEQWVNEGDYMNTYDQDTEVNVEIQKDHLPEFPENLKVFTYPRGNINLFPHPTRDSSGVYDYYVMDAASIVPVIALGVVKGDSVLDLCAAPGGKSLSILQTLYPSRMVCNDLSASRIKRLETVIESYIQKELASYTGRIKITLGDARGWRSDGEFDKVLVDVPCTTDRHSVTEPDNNIFHSRRIKERMELPKIQQEILVAGLRAVKPGGSLVYSTCALSPIQNDGVIHMALQTTWRETKNNYVIKDLTPMVQAFSFIFRFQQGMRYGQLVIPFLPNNFGPTYVAKIVRTS